jgi:carboxyl-terminal processing protease
MLGSAEAGAESALADDGLQFNERKLAKDLAAKKTRDAINDVLLNEAVNIVADSAALKEGKSQMTASASATRPVVVKALLSQGSSEQ